MTNSDAVPVTMGKAYDIYTVDVNMLGVENYGAAFVIDSERPAVVDTGTGANVDRILDAMASVDISPHDLEIVAPTHVHLDHAGGVGYLVEACPNAKVYVHERGARHLVNPERLWEGTKQAVPDWIEYYADPKSVPKDRIVEVEDGDTIDLGERELDIYDAPGHAPHQAVFDDPKSNCVFVADAAGLYTDAFDVPYPTTPPPNFDFTGCLEDIEFLQSLERDGLLFPHCGAAPSDSLLEKYAVRLDRWVTEVESARERIGNDDVDAIIAELESWPDAAAVWGSKHVRETQALNVRGVLARSDSK